MLLLTSILLPALSLCQFSGENTRGGPVTVLTTRGGVTGYRFNQGSDRNQLYYESADVFLGIPFAQPPVGQLKWKLPRAICSYGNGIDATSFKSGCPQSGPGNFSEDCLYLNVFTPGANTAQRAPVMVWIHGGGFNGGATSTFTPPGIVRNFVSRGAVVVTIQYRLGMHGFFTTYTQEFPANRALFDMIMALQWVQDEIGSFGGDPSRVTIWGFSAGSYAVSALSLSPLAQGLFAQTIQQSGGVLQEWTTADTTERSAQRAGQLCGIYSITQQNMQQVLTCLNNARWQDMVRLDGTTRALGDWQLSQDGVFFPDTPSVLARQRPNRPAILGTTKDEVALPFGLLVSPPDSANMRADLSAYNSSFLVPYLLAQRPFLTPYAPVVQDILRKQYAPGNTYAPGNELAAFKASVRAMSDALWAQTTRQDANWQLERGNPNVFLYRYDYSHDICRNMTFQGFPAVGHGYENCLLFMDENVFRRAQAQGQITQNDRAVIDYITSAWVNFAFRGVPNQDWSPVSSRMTMEYIKIDSSRSMNEHYEQRANSIFNAAIASIAGEYPLESIRSRDWLLWINERYASVMRAEWNQYARCERQG